MDAAIGNIVSAPVPVRTGSADLRVEAPSSAPAAQERSVAFSSRNSTKDAKDDSRQEFKQDAATGSMVFRVIDIANGMVMTQTPSEARLKLRAYIDQVVQRTTADPSFEATA